MKKYSIIGLAMTAVIGMAAIPAQAAAPFGLEAGGDIGAFSQYVWRGAPQTTDKVAVQGDVGLSKEVGSGALTASVWASNTFASNQPQFGGRDAIEFDWTLDYSGSINGIGYTAGVIYYTYLRQSDANFLEIYGGFSYDAVVSPSVAVYYTVADVAPALNNLNETGDVWLDVGLDTSYMGVDLSAAISFAFYDSDPTRLTDELAGQFDDGASVVTLGISKDFDVSGVTITPSLTGTIPIASKALDGERYIYNTVSENDVVFAVNVAF